MSNLIVPANRWSKTGYSYKGARQTRFRDFGVAPVSTKSEEEVLIACDRAKITARLFDLYRNSELVKAICESYATSIGTPTLRSDNLELEEFYFNYFKEVEITGENLSSVLRMIVAQLLLSGEVFISFLANGRIQLIEGSMIGSGKEKKPNEVQGIILNRFNQPTGYRLGKRTERGIDFDEGTILSAKTTLHVFKKQRPNQVRGIPELAAALPALQDIEELVHAKVQQAKNGAMLSAVVKKNDPHEEFDGEELRSDYRDLYTNSFYYLETNEDLDMIESNTNATDFETFLKQRIRAVLATVGIPYEIVFGFTGSNYSSSKATRGIFNAKIKEDRAFFEAKFLNRLLTWRNQKAANEDGLETDVILNWGWSALSSLDPQRDAETNAKNLENNLTNLQSIYAENGKYWEEELEQRAKEIAFAKKLAAEYEIEPSDLVDTQTS